MTRNAHKNLTRSGGRPSRRLWTVIFWIMCVTSTARAEDASDPWAIRECGKDQSADTEKCVALSENARGAIDRAIQRCLVKAKASERQQECLQAFYEREAKATRSGMRAVQVHVPPELLTYVVKDCDRRFDFVGCQAGRIRQLFEVTTQYLDDFESGNEASAVAAFEAARKGKKNILLEYVAHKCPDKSHSCILRELQILKADFNKGRIGAGRALRANRAFFLQGECHQVKAATDNKICSVKKDQFILSQDEIKKLKYKPSRPEEALEGDTFSELASAKTPVASRLSYPSACGADANRAYLRQEFCESHTAEALANAHLEKEIRVLQGVGAREVAKNELVPELANEARKGLWTGYLNDLLAEEFIESDCSPEGSRQRALAMINQHAGVGASVLGQHSKSTPQSQRLESCMSHTYSAGEGSRPIDQLSKRIQGICRAQRGKDAQPKTETIRALERAGAGYEDKLVSTSLAAQEMDYRIKTLREKKGCTARHSTCGDLIDEIEECKKNPSSSTYCPEWVDSSTGTVRLAGYGKTAWNEYEKHKKAKEEILKEAPQLRTFMSKKPGDRSGGDEFYKSVTPKSQNIVGKVNNAAQAKRLQTLINDLCLDTGNTLAKNAERDWAEKDQEVVDGLLTEAPEYVEGRIQALNKDYWMPAACSLRPEAQKRKAEEAKAAMYWDIGVTVGMLAAGVLLSVPSGGTSLLATWGAVATGGAMTGYGLYTTNRDMVNADAVLRQKQAYVQSGIIKDYEQVIEAHEAVKDAEMWAWVNVGGEVLGFGGGSALARVLGKTDDLSSLAQDGKYFIDHKGNLIQPTDDDLKSLLASKDVPEDVKKEIRDIQADRLASGKTYKKPEKTPIKPKEPEVVENPAKREKRLAEEGHFGEKVTDDAGNPLNEVQPKKKPTDKSREVPNKPAEKSTDRVTDRRKVTEEIRPVDREVPKPTEAQVNGWKTSRAAKAPAFDRGGNVRHIENSARDDLIYFDSDLAILKELNDKVFKKNLAYMDAAEDLYREILWKELRDAGLLDEKILEGRYGDYKRISLAFKRGSIPEEELQRRLNEAYQKASQKFEQELNDSPLKAFYEGQGRELTRNPKLWHHACLGATADLASACARASRAMGHDGGLPSVRNFDDPVVQAKLGESLGDVEKYRVAVTDDFKKRGWKDFLSTGCFDKASPCVLSDRFTQFVRKYRYPPERMVSEFKREFDGLEIDEATARNLQQYYDSVDRFSPAPWIPERTTISQVTGQEGDLISLDYRNVGAANHQALQKALAAEAKVRGGHPTSRIESAVIAARKSEGEVTSKLDSQKAKTDTGWSEVDPKGTSNFAGDDGGYLTFGALSDQQKRDAVAILSHDSNAFKPRIGFVPERFSGSGGGVIPPQTRSSLVGRSQNLEIQVRDRLKGRIKQEELDDLTVAVDFRPTSANDGTVNLIFSTGKGKKVPASKIRAAARAALKSMPELKGFKLGKVEYVVSRHDDITKRIEVMLPGQNIERSAVGLPHRGSPDQRMVGQLSEVVGAEVRPGYRPDRVTPQEAKVRKRPKKERVTRDIADRGKPSDQPTLHGPDVDSPSASQISQSDRMGLAVSALQKKFGLNPAAMTDGQYEALERAVKAKNADEMEKILIDGGFSKEQAKYLVEHDKVGLRLKTNDDIIPDEELGVFDELAADAGRGPGDTARWTPTAPVSRKEALSSSEFQEEYREISHGFYMSPRGRQNSLESQPGKVKALEDAYLVPKDLPPAKRIEAQRRILKKAGFTDDEVKLAEGSLKRWNSPKEAPGGPHSMDEPPPIGTMDTGIDTRRPNLEERKKLREPEFSEEYREISSKFYQKNSNQPLESQPAKVKALEDAYLVPKNLSPASRVSMQREILKKAGFTKEELEWAEEGLKRWNPPTRGSVPIQGTPSSIADTVVEGGGKLNPEDSADIAKRSARAQKFIVKSNKRRYKSGFLPPEKEVALARAIELEYENAGRQLFPEQIREQQTHILREAGFTPSEIRSLYRNEKLTPGKRVASPGAKPKSVRPKDAGTFVDTGEDAVPEFVQRPVRELSDDDRIANAQWVLSDKLGREVPLSRKKKKAIIEASQVSRREPVRRAAILRRAGFSSREAEVILSENLLARSQIDEIGADAEYVIRQRTGDKVRLTRRQKEGIYEAHLVGKGEIGKDDVNLAGIDNYKPSHLRRKKAKLREYGVPEKYDRALMEGKVIGVKSSAAQRSPADGRRAREAAANDTRIVDPDDTIVVDVPRDPPVRPKAANELPSPAQAANDGGPTVRPSETKTVIATGRGEVNNLSVEEAFGTNLTKDQRDAIASAYSVDPKMDRSLRIAYQLDILEDAGLASRKAKQWVLDQNPNVKASGGTHFSPGNDLPVKRGGTQGIGARATPIQDPKRVWTPQERITGAEGAIGRKFTKKERDALLAAHGIGKGFGQYTRGELVRKGLRLRRAGFSKAEVKVILDEGWAGEYNVVFEVPPRAPRSIPPGRMIDVDRELARVRSRVTVGPHGIQQSSIEKAKVGCPGNLEVTANGIRHSSSHFSGTASLDTPEDAVRNLFAREKTATTVFPSEVTPGDVLARVLEKDNWIPDHKLRRLAKKAEKAGTTVEEYCKISNKDCGSFAFDTTIHLDHAEFPGDYQVRIVVRPNPSGDKGQIVSIIPVCGPGVVEIPALEVVQQHISSNSGGPSPIRVKPCP